MSLESDMDFYLRMTAQQGIRQDMPVKREAVLASLRKRILAGESTGDRIRDFVFYHDAHHQDARSLGQAEQQLRALENLVQGKEGSTILVVQKNEYLYNAPFTDEGACETYDLDIVLMLGKLSSALAFDLKPGTILLPVRKYCWIEKHSLDHPAFKPELFPGPIRIPYVYAKEYGNDIQPKSMRNPEHWPRELSCLAREYGCLEKGLLVHVNDAVEKYFQKNEAFSLLYAQAVQLLQE
ncbi:MAG: hypothetical protein V1743_01280 [Nanoarchaeota archaeon]